MDVVRNSVRRSLKKSLQRCSQELGLSHALSQRILKKDLKLFPYRICIKYKLTPVDMEFLVSVKIIIILMGCIYFETPCAYCIQVEHGSGGSFFGRREVVLVIDDDQYMAVLITNTSLSKTNQKTTNIYFKFNVWNSVPFIRMIGEKIDMKIICVIVNNKMENFILKNCLHCKTIFQHNNFT